jgi:ligand-binding sensor domain-containing protein
MRLLCSILILFWLLPLQATTPSVFDYDIKHWTSADGLASNSVRAVTQDQQGYLWFGTLYGLHRFDGQQFEVFTTETHPHLASNAITQLLTDSEGRIWVGTKAGLSVLQPQELNFERLPLFNEVTSLIEMAPGEIWVAADQLFQVQQGQVKRIEQVKTVVSQLTRHQQQVWVVAAESLYQRDADGSWQQFALPAELRQTPVYDVSWTSEGVMLAAESGLYRLTEAGVIAEPLPDNSKVPVYQVLQDSKGAMWLSAYRKLFYRFQQQDWQTVTVQELGNYPWFSALYQDQSQQLWLTSFSDGVYRAGLTQIRRIQPTSDPVIRSLTLTPQGQLLLAAQTELPTNPGSGAVARTNGSCPLLVRANNVVAWSGAWLIYAEFRTEQLTATVSGVAGAGCQSDPGSQSRRRLDWCPARLVFCQCNQARILECKLRVGIAANHGVG